MLQQASAYSPRRTPSLCTVISRTTHVRTTQPVASHTQTQNSVWTPSTPKPMFTRTQNTITSTSAPTHCGGTQASTWSTVPRHQDIGALNTAPRVRLFRRLSTTLPHHDTHRKQTCQYSSLCLPQPRTPKFTNSLHQQKITLPQLTTPHPHPGGVPFGRASPAQKEFSLALQG